MMMTIGIGTGSPSSKVTKECTTTADTVDDRMILFGAYRLFHYSLTNTRIFYSHLATQVNLRTEPTYP